MSEQPSDPVTLSSEQKDALIRDLRRQLAALQQPKRELLDELREAPHKAALAPAGASMKLGRHLGLWRSPVTLGVVVAVMLAFAVDAGIGRYQASLAKQQRQARLQLENTAMRSLYVELKQIVAEPDGKSFRMTLSLQNTSPDGPLYVMLNPVAVYVQSGMVWQQVPSKPVDGAGAGVVTLAREYSYDIAFAPEVANWAELIPGYMHVRIQDDLLVSQRAQPGDDVVERRTPFYVYLRPPGIAAPPPLFIPMPPH
ncbi:MAG: hypothetical protein Q8K93_16420 [Reyranella sp.]|uniref:hypothetical protein n=1 Tax=Reyranella sp. TaxID=1929291 RepID=UPI002730F977|nr:hypothetical protein [Reyranella sp.]MDP1963778.1 hypothetical protein [Reyranella sp.]MDP2373351.1 hypothetical protein [Reyranella sp.]